MLSGTSRSQQVAATRGCAADSPNRRHRNSWRARSREGSVVNHLVLFAAALTATSTLG
jgi:hypothetical protein